MPNTYPNQRMVKIHREKATTDFLGIKNENWQAASRDLGAHALRLYLYLASNANNFQLALSPAAIRSAIGMARSTYHDQFHILEDKGYIRHLSGNTYEFFETPQPRTVQQCGNQKFSDGLQNPLDVNPILTDVNSIPSKDIEINNINKIDNIINNQEEETYQELFPECPKEEESNTPITIKHGDYYF